MNNPTVRVQRGDEFDAGVSDHAAFGDIQRSDSGECAEEMKIRISNLVAFVKIDRRDVGELGEMFESD